MSEPGQKPLTLDELRAAIELFGHPICVTAEQRFVACNRAMLEISGYSREELLGRHYEDLVPPEDRRRLGEVSLRMAQGESLPEFGFALMQTRSGVVLPVQVSLTRLPAEGGKAFTVGSFLVASGLKTELDLAERLAGVATLLMAQRSPQGIRETAVTVFQRAHLWSGFYAAEKGELKPLVLSSAGGGPQVDPSHVFAALSERRPVFSAIDPSGSFAQVAYLPLRYPGGEEVLVLAGVVTPRSSGVLRLFAEQLAQAYSNARLIADLESGHQEMRLLLELARTTTQSLEVSSILEEAADFVARLLDARAAFIFLVEEEDGPILRVRATSTSVRHDAPNDVRIRPGDGTVVGRVARERVPVSLPDLDSLRTGEYSKPMADRYSAKCVMGVPIIARDELIGVLAVSDGRPRHFAPRQLELAQAIAGQLALSISNARLYGSLMRSYVVLQETRAEMVKRERLAALGELSAVVAHEVRNPLGVIFNAVSSLRRLAPEGDAQGLLDILAEESDRLNRLVGELLDFARPGAPARQAEDVGRVIQDALEAASSDPATANTRVHVSAEVEPGLPPVPMDRRQIRQAVVNVAVNALQSMPRGGSFRVSARRDGAGPGGLQQLRIDLSDDGPGIRVDHLPRIFEPFFTTKAKGTGLGLAVVKRIIEDHEGSVEVRSEVGRGTTFTFRLPMPG